MNEKWDIYKQFDDAVRNTQRITFLDIEYIFMTVSEIDPKIRGMEFAQVIFYDCDDALIDDNLKSLIQSRIR